MAEDGEIDPFAPYRERLRRNYWVLGLQAAETGELLTAENHAKVLELLPEDGIALHLVGARGDVILLVSIPEEQIAPFAEGEWRWGHRISGSLLELVLIVGGGEALECPFPFDLDQPLDLQEAIRLTEQEDLDFYGATHMEEGLMLTLKGAADLPAPFRSEIRETLLAALQRQ